MTPCMVCLQREGDVSELDARNQPCCCTLDEAIAACCLLPEERYVSGRGEGWGRGFSEAAVKW